MERKPLLVALIIIALAGFAVAGCGGDDGDDDAQTTSEAVTDENVADEPEEPDAGEAQPEGEGEPATSGVAAASPRQLKACLEEEGFQVSIDDATPDEVREELGIEAQVAVLGDQDAPGAGAVTYFASEEDAIAGAEANDDAKVPNTVLGRNGTAAYTFTGAGLEAAGRTIEACL